jgi:hypothetical protein
MLFSALSMSNSAPDCSIMIAAASPAAMATERRPDGTKAPQQPSRPVSTPDVPATAANRRLAARRRCAVIWAPAQWPASFVVPATAQGVQARKLCAVIAVTRSVDRPGD